MRRTAGGAFGWAFGAGGGRRLAVVITAVIGLGGTSLQAGPARAAATGARAVQADQLPGQPPDTSGEDHHDTSPPVSSLPPAPHQDEAQPAKPLPSRPSGGNTASPQGPQAATPAVPSPSTTFEGVGQGFSGPQGTFSVNSAPPDTNGDVGPNHYVEIVNTALAVFNKSGSVLYGPVPINTLWSGFGGHCQTDNGGDPVVLHDGIADRWVVSQLANTASTSGPFYLCIAVSTTSDPTGAYNRYAFQYANFPDYPKVAVWPDGYYVSFNMFNPAGTAFLGGQVCAIDRASMLAGTTATQQCFQPASTGGYTNPGGFLPSHLTGRTLPPAGEPNYSVALANAANTLEVWKFHVDWTNALNSTFTGPTNLPVAAYTMACGGGTCIPQSGTGNRLDSLGDRLMFRLSYRNFGSYASMVVDHSVNPSNAASGVRWYELRVTGGTPSVFQQGTYAPDGNSRWMGSAAMDQTGDIAVGYSVSGSVAPQIRYAGRLAGDPAGQLSQGEATVVTGAAQTGGLHRWGDYTSMSVDPTDDCTFWYANEYLASRGSFNWHTRIASFAFPGCGGPPPPPPPNDFSISVAPATLSVPQGSSGSATVSTAVTSGSAQPVSLTISGLPSATTASFNPASVTAGGSSTLGLNVGASTAAGTYPLTITGTATSGSHTASLSLTVTTPPPPPTSGVTNGGFESGLTGWTSAGSTSVSTTAHGGSASAQVGSTSPGGDASLTQTFTVPSAGGTLSLWYKMTCPDTVTYDWATVTLTDNVTNATSTPLPRTCATNSGWVNVTFGLGASAGHSVTLKLANHDDNYPTDPSYTLYDDVAIVAPVANPVVNGGFEAGSFSGWTTSGTTSVTTTAHTGTYGARIGSTSPTATSTVAQTFTVPAGGGSLSFWYNETCPDTITYDWFVVTLTDNTAATTTTVLPKQCTTSGGWVQAAYSLASFAGHSVTVTFTNRDDNYPTDPTYTGLDDVAVQ